MKRTLKGNWKTKQIFINSYELKPERSLQYVYHSPDGFSWGYGGSGPSQLSFAIILELTDDSDNSFVLYQSFKKDFIISLPQSDFCIQFDLEKWTEEQLTKAIKQNKITSQKENV